MQDHHKISLLIGAGAVGVLIYLLMHRASAASNGSLVPDAAVAQSPNYPQNPVPQGNGSLTEIGGSPVNMTYNYGEPLPTLALGDNTGGECGCDTYCETAGQKVTVQTVPANVLKDAHENFASFQSKAQPPRINFSQVPSGASLVQANAVGGQLG